MANSNDSALADFVKQTQAAITLNPMLRPQIEQFWQTQEKMLQEAQAFTQHWFERRHVATKTALKAVKNVANGGSDASGALKTMSDWQKHSIERVFEDFREWVELCTRCAGLATTAEAEAEKAGLKEAARQMKSAAKTKHAIPV